MRDQNIFPALPSVHERPNCDSDQLHLVQLVRVGEEGDDLVLRPVDLLALRVNRLCSRVHCRLVVELGAQAPAAGGGGEVVQAELVERVAADGAVEQVVFVVPLAHVANRLLLLPGEVVDHLRLLVGDQLDVDHLLVCLQPKLDGVLQGNPVLCMQHWVVNQHYWCRHIVQGRLIVVVWGAAIEVVLVIWHQPCPLLDQGSDATWHSCGGLNRSPHVVVEYGLPICSWVHWPRRRPGRSAWLPRCGLRADSHLATLLQLARPSKLPLVAAENTFLAVVHQT